MSLDDRKEANRKTVEKLRELQDDIESRTRLQMKVFEDKATQTLGDLRSMVWITFGVGLVLIAASLLLFIFQQRTLEVLGLGTLGASDWLALLLYKPMDRLQKANADFSQEVVILRAAVISPNLELLAMNVTKPETVIAAAKNIRSGSVEMARAIQEFVET